MLLNSFISLRAFIFPVSNLMDLVCFQHWPCLQIFNLSAQGEGYCLRAPTAALLPGCIIKVLQRWATNNTIYNNIPFLGFLIFVSMTSAGSCSVDVRAPWMPRLVGEVHQQANDGKAYRRVGMKKG